MQKAWLNHRQATEHLIGHTKAGHRIDRCWLSVTDGDALHAVLRATGSNIRQLLRAIPKRGLSSFLLLALTVVAMALYTQDPLARITFHPVRHSMIIAR